MESRGAFRVYATNKDMRVQGAQCIRELGAGSITVANGDREWEMHKLLGLFLSFASVLCDVVLHSGEDAKGVRYYSFEIFPTNPPVSKDKHVFLIPDIDPATCKLDFKSIPPYAGKSGQLALVVIPRDACLSYAFPVSDLPTVKESLAKLKYPAMSVVAWVSLPGELQPPGNPNSDLMLPDFRRDDSVSYHVIEDTAIDKLLSAKNDVLEGTISEGARPWFGLLKSSPVHAVQVGFDIFKALMLGVQVFILLLSFLRSNSSGYIPILLLIVGFLQIGGDLIISRYALFGMAANVFVMALLIVACLVNSLVILSWYRILRRLDIAPVRISFLVVVGLESAILFITLLIQLVLVIFLNHRWGIRSGWFSGLLMLTMILVTACPILIKSWLVTQIWRFSLAAGPMRRLTMTVFFTRIAFLVLMVASNLQFQQSTTPVRYFTFGTLRDSALLIYNAMTILTVLNIQSIRPPKSDTITLTPSTYAYESDQKVSQPIDHRRDSSSSQAGLVDSDKKAPNLAKSKLSQGTDLSGFDQPFADDSLYYSKYSSVPRATFGQTRPQKT